MKFDANYRLLCFELSQLKIFHTSIFVLKIRNEAVHVLELQIYILIVYESRRLYLWSDFTASLLAVLPLYAIFVSESVTAVDDSMVKLMPSYPSYGPSYCF